MDDGGLSTGLAPYMWRLGITLFFVLANGFFVAAEFALVKVRGTRLDALVDEGHGRARVARHLLDHLDHYLSACQLGITLASLILGWLAEPAIAELLVLGAGWAGIDVEAHSVVTHAIALGIALTIVTILHMTVGEQAPKIWAIRRPEQMSLLVAYPLRIFSAVFRPFIWFINTISNAMLRAAGLASSEHGDSHDVQEIKQILATSAAAGQIEHDQVEFAANVLNLVELETRHILVPRIDVALLTTNRSSEENLQTIVSTGHTRFPLCETDLDSVLGIVHVKDLSAALLAGEAPDLPTSARPTLFVTENRSLARLIGLMQREGSHCAVVLDEYGTALGLAFLEDALEQVVGTIRDEFDPEVPGLAEQTDGSVLVPGGLSLPEARERFELPAEGNAADTIGGYVVARLGRLPAEGDEIFVPGHRIEVAAVERHRIVSLRVHACAGAHDEDAEADAG